MIVLKFSLWYDYRSASQLVIFLSQVEDKDVELRELKSALANLKDHHDQAQSKVWITNTFIHVCSIVSAPCAAQCWISRWERKGPVLFPGLARFNIQDGGRTVYENVDCVDWRCDSFPHSELFLVVYSKVSHREEALQRLQAQQKDFVEEVLQFTFVNTLKYEKPYIIGHATVMVWFCRLNDTRQMFRIISKWGQKRGLEWL